MRFRLFCVEMAVMQYSCLCYNYIKRCWGQKPWAKIFADELFPAIDEKRFSVLYSEQESRPNTPVNVIVGALIIKEMFDYANVKI